LDPAFLKVVLGGIVPPFAIAVAFLLPRLRRAGDASRAEGGIGVLGALGLGLALAVGTAFLLGGFEGVRRPVSVLQKLAWLGLAGGVGGALDLALGARDPARLAARALLRVGLPATLLWWFLGFVRAQGGGGEVEAALWIGALAAGVALLWSGLDFLGGLRPGPSLPIAWAASAGGAGLALLLSSSASLGQTAGALASALAGLAAVALANRHLSARGAGGPTALALAGLLLAGRYAADLTALGALLCAVAPLLPGLVELLPVRRSPRTAGALRVLLAAAPPLYAAWLAHAGAAAQSTPY